jgi:dipeptidyl aminopeptidase/acylaminoacyl peptidase
MKTAIIAALTLFLGFTLGWFTPTLLRFNSESDEQVVAPTPPPTPLYRYALDSLRNYQPTTSPIKLAELLFEEDELAAYRATYQTGGKNMSLQVMVPKTATPSAGFPVILLNRGFVDPSIYQTGVGTKNFARFATARGYLTISPDFLGYGLSDPPAADTMEARIEKPAQLLDLIESLKDLNLANQDKIGIWGHSNGGQIALSLLTITGKPYPTVLWAPVTKPFPYSILYYTDQYTDRGKALRKTVADFEMLYDVERFSIEQYLSLITAPIQIHQGGQDLDVPISWNDDFVKALEAIEIDIDYHRYPQADHNMVPNWNDIAVKSISFFDLYLKE